MALLSTSENPLLHEDEIASLLEDDHFLTILLGFEKTLAEAQAKLGIIPDAAAAAIQQLTIEHVEVGALHRGMERDGVVVPALLYQLRETLTGANAQWLHFGVASQDALDTSLVLILREVNEVILSRLDSIVRNIADLADQHRGTLLMARTRQRSAVPTSFGFMAASWLAPLLQQKLRIQEMQPRLYRLQLGGAAGHLSALGKINAARLVPAMGEALDLHVAPGSWQNQRDNLVEYGNWLAMSCGCLAKLAEDLIVMSADEVAEVSVSLSGASSSMPQKQNPVRLEHIITLHRFVIAQQAGMQQTQVNVMQRDGRSWMLEWLTLPSMAMATGKSMHLAGRVLAELEVHPDRMQENIKGNLGLVYAEAATFKLAEFTAPGKARELISKACQKARNSQAQLLDVLTNDADVAAFGIDWRSLADTGPPGVSEDFIQQILDSMDS